MRSCLGPRLAFHPASPSSATHRRCGQRLVCSGTRSSRSTTLDSDVQTVIEAIHATPTRVALTVTGGGVQVVSWLLGVPGASRTVLDVQVPYSPPALAAALHGQAPPSAASVHTAAALAEAAYRRAAALTTFGSPVVGLACTAALSTDRTRRGDDKIFVASHGSDWHDAYSLVLDKGRGRARWTQDALASRLVLHALARATGADTGSATLEQWLGLGPGDALEARAGAGQGGLRGALHALAAGKVACVEAGAGAVLAGAPRPGRLYLPGSFNPLHHGHRAMLQAALDMSPGMEGCYELSIGNADKGTLCLEEVERRVAQFEAVGAPVVLTQAPLYAQKAELFPGSVFVVGYDTALRLLKQGYYGTMEDMLLQASHMQLELDRLGGLGCSFLVAGRLDVDTGVYMSLEHLDVPPQLKSLFRAIPESTFRADVSSSEIRARQAS